MDMDMPEPLAPAPAPAPAAVVPPRSRRGAPVFAVVLALAALGAAGYAAWRTTALERDSSGALAAATATRTEIDALNRRVDQANRDREILRQRLDDIDAVNKSLREELLGMGERARVLEDAVANLAEKRLSGHDSLLLDEAEMLLRLGQERYDLFRDAAQARQAYALADEALSAVDDPAFATVRETVAVESKALAAQRDVAAGAGVAELERLRSGLEALPLRRAGDAKADENPSRLWQLLGRFVRISHAAAGTPDGDRGLARALVSLDLRGAEAALLARDMPTYRAALQRARGLAQASFDAETPAARELLDALQRLGSESALPPPADLGAALRELRNLRSTHRLQGGAKPAAATP
jgi:uroporphyrin-3 C-methyltransferase